MPECNMFQSLPVKAAAEVMVKEILDWQGLLSCRRGSWPILLFSEGILKKLPSLDLEAS